MRSVLKLKYEGATLLATRLRLVNKPRYCQINNNLTPLLITRYHAQSTAASSSSSSGRRISDRFSSSALCDSSGFKTISFSEAISRCQSGASVVKVISRVRRYLKGQEPDSVTYSLAIKKAAELRDFHHCWKLFGQAKWAGRADGHVYNQMINLCSQVLNDTEHYDQETRAKKFTLMIRLFGEMRNNNNNHDHNGGSSEVTLVTHSIVLNACVIHNQLDFAKKYFDQCNCDFNLGFQMDDNDEELLEEEEKQMNLKPSTFSIESDKIRRDLLIWLGASMKMFSKQSVRNHHRRNKHAYDDDGDGESDHMQVLQFLSQIRQLFPSLILNEVMIQPVFAALDSRIMQSRRYRNSLALKMLPDYKGNHHSHHSQINHHYNNNEERRKEIFEKIAKESEQRSLLISSAEDCALQTLRDWSIQQVSHASNRMFWTSLLNVYASNGDVIQCWDLLSFMSGNKRVPHFVSKSDIWLQNDNDFQHWFLNAIIEQNKNKKNQMIDKYALNSALKCLSQHSLVLSKELRNNNNNNNNNNKDICVDEIEDYLKDAWNDQLWPLIDRILGLFAHCNIAKDVSTFATLFHLCGVCGSHLSEVSLTLITMRDDNNDSSSSVNSSSSLLFIKNKNELDHLMMRLMKVNCDLDRCLKYYTEMIHECKVRPSKKCMHGLLLTGLQCYHLESGIEGSKQSKKDFVEWWLSEMHIHRLKCTLSVDQLLSLKLFRNSADGQFGRTGMFDAMERNENNKTHKVK